MQKKYKIQKALAQRNELDGNWQGNFWANVQSVELTNHIFDPPQHRPRTQAKVVYDDKFIYVIFRVEDNYVLSVQQNHQDNVCRDSCAEFFFTPGADTSVGYFNIEINAGGTALFHYQLIPWTNEVSIANSDIEQMQIYHSEPAVVEPEKQEPVTWIIEYRIPLDILEKYCDCVRPGPGVVWKGNFYKCADNTSHPHWLNWSAIDESKKSGSFHVPEFFGTLEFE